MSNVEDLATKLIIPKQVDDIEELCRFYYIKGYHQAEKDLDISWVKEVSGVKDMSRAKEEALKAYPPRSIAANYDTISRRDAFEYGYLKAEKDLELTWEDISIIRQIMFDYNRTIRNEMTIPNDEEYCQEVLKRFKAQKVDIVMDE